MKMEKAKGRKSRLGTKASSITSNKKLPPFLQWHKPPQEDALDAWDVHREEYFLRTRAYHAVSRKIDAAFESAMEELLVSSNAYTDLKQLQSLCRKGVENKADGNDLSLLSSEGQPTLSDDIETSRATQTRASEEGTYSDTLLPIWMLHAPSDRLDRHAWMQHLVLASKKRNPRTCTVWLQHELPVAYAEEIVRQCIRQEPEKDIFPTSQKKLLDMSLTDILLLWASSTQHFDTIDVYLELENNFYGHSVTDLIGWMSERVAMYGVPFTLILTAPAPGRRPMDLGPAVTGTTGIIVNECYLPSPKKVLELFWEMVSDHIPFPIVDGCQEELAAGFEFVDNSAAKTVIRIKKLLAHHLKNSGSLSLFKQEEVTMEELRMKWFGLDPLARRIAFGVETYEELRGKRMHTESIRAVGRLSLSSKQSLAESVTVPSFLRLSKSSKLSNQLPQDSRFRLLSQFSSLRSKLRSNPTVFQGMNELIVLVDQCSTIDDTIRCLDPHISRWALLSNELCSLENHHGVLDSNIRRQVSRSLVLNSRETLHIGNVVAKLYACLLDRTTISKSEWFDEFQSITPNNLPKEEVFKMFLFGVYQLMWTGIVKERSVTTKNTTYEKVTVVWCGGD